MAKRILGGANRIDITIGGSTPIEPSINNEIKSNVGERTTGVNVLDSPQTQLKEAGFISELTSKKRRIDGLAQGTSLSTFYPFSNSQILDSFRTQNINPNVDDVVENTTELVNEKHPIDRLVKPVSDTLDIGEYELAILYKENENNLQTMAIGNSMYQMNALNEVSPAQFNFLIFQYQYDLFKREPEKFASLAPEDLWFKFSIEGVIEAEEMANGAESRITSGFNFTNASYPHRESKGIKRCTIIGKGPQYVFNYWGDSIKQGYDAYFVFKKVDVPSDYYFMLSNKLNITALTGYQQLNPAISFEHFKPFQLCPFCLPGKQVVPRAYKHYYDENQIKRMDGVVIKVGTFFSVSPTHKFKYTENYNPPPVTLKSDVMKGYNDATKGAKRDEIMLPKLIIDCHDGIKDF